jgi:lipopolysaccharide assembly outer membrane protein LptD (OstA)
MNIKISDKCDQKAVNEIIAIGYPNNIQYMNELLSWTCDPNWPIAGSIYKYFIKLGKNEVHNVLKMAENDDFDWRYSLITQIISSYDEDAINECIEHLKKWASQTGSEECDFESIRVLTDRELIPASEIAKIAKRNLFVYNVWIKETLEAAGKAIYSFPFGDHKL